MRGSKDFTSVLQMRTHCIFCGKHAKLFTFTKEPKVTKLEEPMIRLKFGVFFVHPGLAEY